MAEILKDYIRNRKKKKVINFFTKREMCICNDSPVKFVIVSQETIGLGEHLLTWKCTVCGCSHKRRSKEVYRVANI